MAPSIFIPAILLLVGCVGCVFWPQAKASPVVEKTRLDYLRERKEVLFDNLRDLNFEYKAGKYPEADFAAQRDSLEVEAASILAEMHALESGMAV
jgi:hypothetical protein